MTSLPKNPSAKKLGLVVDLDICVGCHACSVHCKEWNTSGHSAPLTDEDPYGAEPSLIVILAIPFSLVGGVWLMYFLDYNMSVAVAVGFIALAGLAAETGIVMLAYLDEVHSRRKAEGRPRSARRSSLSGIGPATALSPRDQASQLRRPRAHPGRLQDGKPLRSRRVHRMSQ